MLKADEGEGKLEDEKEKKQGGEQGRLPRMAGGDGDEGGGDKVELSEEFEGEQDAEGRICLCEEAGGARCGE